MDNRPFDKWCMDNAELIGIIWDKFSCSLNDILKDEFSFEDLLRVIFMASSEKLYIKETCIPDDKDLPKILNEFINVEESTLFDTMRFAEDLAHEMAEVIRNVDQRFGTILTTNIHNYLVPEMVLTYYALYDSIPKSAPDEMDN